MEIDVPAVSHRARIDVRASADAAFAVVAADLLATDDDRDAMVGHRPLQDGPLREGFRWQQTIVHDRKVCRTDWVVTQLRPPWLLEQTMEQLCAVSRRELLGGERWELEVAGDGSTLVTLCAWRLCPGLEGWLQKIRGAGPRNEASLSLSKRLAHVQFTAERRPAGTVG